MPAQKRLKLILLGDSASGKSKLVERFMMDGYHEEQQSTYALTLFQYKGKVDGKDVEVDIWDTAGQEKFFNVHASYFHGAHACIFVFDVTRKQTYKNLEKWYSELRQYRPDIPCICVANKIDIDPSATQKKFGFATKYDMKMYFVSAADGRNVVKTFKEAVQLGKEYMDNPKHDIEDDILDLLKDDTVKTEESS